MATHITPVGRIAIYEDKELHGLMQAGQVRPRVAFPDQRRLPECYQRKGRLLYPRQFGIDRITKALANKLENLGVKIHTDTSIQSLKLSNQKIQSMTIESPKGIQEINTARIFWGGGLPGLAKMLDIKQEGNFQFQKAAFINLVLDKPLQTEDLYYFYVFDQGFSTFRVTNYSAYCPGAINEKGYPVCVCLWLDKDLTEDEMIQLAISELKKMSVIDDSYKVNFAKPEFTNGFPKMTVANISLMDTLRDKISELKIENLNTVGILSQKGLFYLTEILVDAFTQARSLKISESEPKRLFTEVKRQNVNV
jgi:protoporphyrinogen oxidase